MKPPDFEAIRIANFDWTTRLASVWDDPAWDVPNLHEEVRRRFVDKLEAITAAEGFASPLGWVINGSGGTGKTHLLGAFRREAARRNAAFVLVDMTDVRDFWATVLQGYIGSLQVRYEGDLFQHQFILRNLIEQQFQAKVTKPAAEILAILARQKSTDLARDIQKPLGALYKVHPAEVMKYHNTIRALVCWNSDDFSIASTGQAWLLGQEIDADDCRMLGFDVPREAPRRIVEALSWIMSLSGPTVLAFDQLDPIVTQLAFQRASEASNEERFGAEAIISGIGGGLGALYDVTKRTLVVVSCVESTWHTLEETVLKTFLDRFVLPPDTLGAVQHRAVAEAVVRNRLAEAFRTADFDPPYATWPFRPEAFDELALSTPREVLKKCEAWRERWIRRKVIDETSSFMLPDDKAKPAADLARLDEQFEAHRAEANSAAIVEVGHEDEQLAPLLQAALHCLLHEHDLPDDVDAQVDEHFTGGSKTQPLHARLRLVFVSEKNREEHFCLRALQVTHARAFQSRLGAAMTESGIDHALTFRHLGIVRTLPAPGGAVTQKTTERFTAAGGRFLVPSDDELRTLHAVFRMKHAGDPDLRAWLKLRKPLSKLAIMRQTVPSRLLFGDEPAVPQNPATPSASAASVLKTKPVRLDSAARQAAVIPLGNRMTEAVGHAPLTMPVTMLEKHTLVVAGAGSGKTVLLKRLIEEAALVGVPSIVIDGANDLAALDEPWPKPPETWGPKDPAKAARFGEVADVVVWTPGKESGNPVCFEPLPDLAAVADDDEEFAAAVEMARDALVPIVAAGTSTAAKNAQGILSKSLSFFGKHGGGTLGSYIDLLANLPEDARLGLVTEEKLARQMSDALRVAVETNPLLRSQGAPLDPALLFGDDLPMGRTRVSVISLIGLRGEQSARHFLNQLAMTLFAWIKKHPDPHPRPLRGLLVIDEARDYVPSLKSSACKESLARLVAQARKYHLGIIFATQNPKDIETRIVANCSTQYFGKVNSPAALAAARDQIKQKGGTGDELARMPRGQFYVHNADLGLSAPEHVTIPMCLSCHRSSPLDETEIMKKAARSRSDRREQ
jgi:hypothetical protein